MSHGQGIVNTKRSDKGHRARVAESEKRAAKYEKKLRPPQALSRDRTDRTAMKEGEYPVGTFLQGHWIRLN